MKDITKAVVLLSGGLDSTVCLAKAIDDGHEPIPLTIGYGQRHERELQAARDVVDHYGIGEHHLVELDLQSFTSSALTSDQVPVPHRESTEEIGGDIPATYVPARNIIFLSIAAGLAETKSAQYVYIGANAVDYSGYPDCRPEFFEVYQELLEVGTKSGVEGDPVIIKTPILRLTKVEIIGLGMEIGAPLHLTWSCYEGGDKACGSCDSCQLRLKGFRAAGFADPIEYE